MNSASGTSSSARMILRKFGWSSITFVVPPDTLQSVPSRRRSKVLPASPATRWHRLKRIWRDYKSNGTPTELAQNHPGRAAGSACAIHLRRLSRRAANHVHLGSDSSDFCGRNRLLPGPDRSRSYQRNRPDHLLCRCVRIYGRQPAIADAGFHRRGNTLAGVDVVWCCDGSDHDLPGQSLRALHVLSAAYGSPVVLSRAGSFHCWFLDPAIDVDTGVSALAERTSRPENSDGSGGNLRNLHRVADGDAAGRV